MPGRRRARAPRGYDAPVTEDAPDLVRLNRFLALAGVCSRRAADDLIRDGRVRVDGAAVPESGVKVDPVTSVVTVDGRRVGLQEAVHLAFHKPKGVVCTNADGERRRRVIDCFPRSAGRLYPVGRLDADSTGLILVTNDGGFAEKVAHPKHGIEKIYEVLVKGRPTADALGRLREGVHLGDTETSACRVHARPLADGGTVLTLTLGEGKNREIRRMCARVGYPALELRRVRIGTVTLGELAVGAHRPLAQREIDDLLAGRNQRGQGGRS